MFRPARLFSSKNRRAPLQWTPRRSINQSVDDQIRALHGAWGDALSLPLCLALLALYEWWRWLFSMAPNPLLFTFIAAVAIHATWRRRKRYRSELQQLRLTHPAQPTASQIVALLQSTGIRLLQELTARLAPATVAAALRRILSPANGLAKRLATAFMNNPG
ncbi:MAG TPA: hypothetical protein PKV55_12445 [Nitrospira sp.]|nr:hypothetical protein [Nitrospira sp.]MBS0176268.1 hypothetical protein [Nitrospira sp.]MBS0180299.1 hypothetical protein [Nitrospira sp.]MBX3336086.1 hypothetical protein [Nitrospira sp.]MCW5778742.1 hypothetical protein [Nitrospira sp.]